MTLWLDHLRQALRGPLVRHLEDAIARERAQREREQAESQAEIARLREENRAMLNSLLGVAGAPPVETPRPQPAGAPPIRRRSWPQFAASREFAATREATARDRNEPPP